MKKLSMLFTGAILSAVVLTGCNNNDNQNPPPPTNNNLNTPDVNDNIDRNMNNLNDRYRNNNLNDNINNRYNNNLNDLNDNMDHYSPAEDKNTPTDKDWIKDSNTKKEDIIEDDIDVNDRDTKDE